MTSPSSFPFPSLVDSTIMSAFDSCQQKMAYEFGHHLSPLAINPDLHAGGAFSHGIAIVRTGLYQHQLSLETSLMAGARGMFEFWGDFEPPPKNPKTLEAMIGALDDYFNTYNPESDPYKPYVLAAGKPAVEFSFSIPVGEGPVIFLPTPNHSCDLFISRLPPTVYLPLSVFLHNLKLVVHCLKDSYPTHHSSVDIVAILLGTKAIANELSTHTPDRVPVPVE